MPNNLLDTKSVPHGTMPARRFDVIVCGAGPAGCVVAARLAADPSLTILLLEAGGSDDTDLVRNPDLWPRTLGTGLDWNLRTDPNPRLAGRSIPYGMGRVLGGGSSINVCTWSRGHRADWDGTAAAARDGSWAHDAVLDLYRTSIERWTGTPDPASRGRCGPMSVRPAQNRHPFSEALLQAAARLGLPSFPDANGALMQAAGGASFVDETIEADMSGADRRRSVYRSYVHPLLDHPNLHVLTGAVVTDLLVRGTRVAGVLFLHAGARHEVEAGHEVVLSLGAVQTPAVLLRSGIGDEAGLRAADVPLRHELPGVGRGLHDHTSLGLVWESDGPDVLPPVPRSQTACFWTTGGASDSPDSFCYARAGSAMTPENAGQVAVPGNTWSLLLGMRPHSRGSVRLTGSAPGDPLRIDPGYLADRRDLENLKAAVGFARALGNAPELRPFTRREVAPGDGGPDRLDRYIRRGLGTFWHQCGTARMGCGAGAVVDGQLRVHGLAGLRIADASVLPRVTTGNTMAPCVVVGEQAARFITRDLGLSPVSGGLAPEGDDVLRHI